jgi:Cu/Ag efflux pump CusA
MGAGDAVFVGGVLKSLGLPGAIIIVLMFVISMLTTAIIFMQKHANKVYGYRLRERDVLNKALSDSTVVLQQMVRASEERNEVTEGLADVTRKQAVAFDQVNERIKVHYEVMKDDLSRLAQVATAIAEAVRNINGICDALRRDAEDHHKVLVDHIDKNPPRSQPRRIKRGR